MENARILVIDDMPDIPEFVGMTLLGSSHRVAEVATTREEAFQRLEQIRGGTLDCNVVLLDGNLHCDSKNAEDAAAISQRIQELQLPVRIIGFSASPLPRHIKVDKDISKINLANLEDTIDELEEPKVAYRF